jgi:hypothetical protein
VVRFTLPDPYVEDFIKAVARAAANGLVQPATGRRARTMNACPVPPRPPPAWPRPTARGHRIWIRRRTDVIDLTPARPIDGRPNSAAISSWRKPTIRTRSPVTAGSVRRSTTRWPSRPRR